MPQSLSSILIHLVFSTKNREPFITPVIESELHPYMASIFRDLKSPSLIIDGTMDHVHVLFSLARSITIADVVEEVKTGSSKWIDKRERVQELPLAKRLWRVFNRAIKCHSSQTLYPKSETTSSPRNL